MVKTVWKIGIGTWKYLKKFLLFSPNPAKAIFWNTTPEDANICSIGTEQNTTLHFSEYILNG